jgi:MoxR-like ATPase
VLIDEIDKADPDVPNNLLVALGSLRFTVPYLNNTIVATKTPPLVLITSNDERELPLAFLRRCIVLELKAPDPERIIAIAEEHFGKATQDRKLYKAIADLAFPEVADPSRDRTPSTAEFLDAVRTCLKLKVKPSDKDKTWQTVASATLWKPSSPTGDPSVR